MAEFWTPGAKLLCRVCGARFALHQVERFQRHIVDCVERHSDALDKLRPSELFEGDPELAAFAREEGDPYNRRPGTRKKAR